MAEPGRAAIGTWSGGRYLHFGEAIDEERLVSLLRPGDGIETLLTADAYGQGEADRVLGTALAGVPRDEFSLVGAVGHDFYEGERNGPKGFPRFTDPALRGPDQYASYLRMATEASLERIGASSFDVLLLHNPDRTGYSSEVVWDGMEALREAGLTAEIGVAPGPANGFTLDLISCLERFGERIDWAMIILNPFEPWPGELCLGAAERHDVKVITRVSDFGGIFWGDMRPGMELSRTDHRSFRPAGWIEQGLEKLALVMPYAEKAGLTPIQLAAQWNLAHPAVECVAPTLIQEADAGGPSDRGEAGRAGRAAGREPPHRLRRRRDPGDRRQRRLHGAQGRQPRARGRGAARPLAAQRGVSSRPASAGASTPARPRRHR